MKCFTAATKTHLYFGALHIDTQAWSSFEKHLVIVPSIIRALTNTPKAIEIQLPLKARDFRLTKETGHDICFKATMLVDGKSPTVDKEREYVCQSFPFTRIQTSVKLFRKRLCNTTTVPTGNSSK